MNSARLTQFFEQRRERGEPLVLVSVFETRGSTYSKPGARMLVDRNGIFQGMLSGGCLEGDLAIRAAVVIDSGTPQIVDYDLAQDDELWGLGVGCDGLMRVFLQPLVAESGYEPFAAYAAILAGDEAAQAVTVVESDSQALAAGASAVATSRGVQAWGMSAEDAGRLLGAAPAGDDATAEIVAAGGRARVFHASVEPPPRLLILGAGLDAEPVVRFGSELGWRCTVSDHRESYIESGRFDAAEQVLCVPADALSDTIDLARYDRCIVMSHHLVSDRSYLRQLAVTDIAYVGLLGPVNRRKRLLAELGDDGSRLQGRLHGPAGLDFGGSGPAAIALSIVAEMQLVLGRHSSWGNRV